MTIDLINSLLYIAGWTVVETDVDINRTYELQVLDENTGFTVYITLDHPYDITEEIFSEKIEECWNEVDQHVHEYPEIYDEDEEDFLFFYSCLKEDFEQIYSAFADHLKNKVNNLSYLMQRYDHKHQQKS